MRFERFSTMNVQSDTVISKSQVNCENVPIAKCRDNEPFRGVDLAACFSPTYAIIKI